MFASSRERRLWALAALALVAIYATLGRAPAIAAALRDRRILDNVFFVAFLLVVAAVLVLAIVHRPGPRQIAVGILMAAVYLTATLRFGIPEERTHLFEFGVVAVLIYLALAERRAAGRRVPAPALMAAGIGAAAGIIDELIQWVLPNRVFDIRDIGFNVGASALAVLAVAALRRARTADRKA